MSPKWSFEILELWKTLAKPPRFPTVRFYYQKEGLWDSFQTLPFHHQSQSIRQQTVQGNSCRSWKTWSVATVIPRIDDTGLCFSSVPIICSAYIKLSLVRGLIHFQRSTINISCYHHLWHQFYTVGSKTRLAISIFYVKFNLSKSWLSFQIQFWLCYLDHHLLFHNIDYRSMGFISILRFSSTYV